MVDCHNTTCLVLTSEQLKTVGKSTYTHAETQVPEHSAATKEMGIRVVQHFQKYSHSASELYSWQEQQTP